MIFNQFEEFGNYLWHYDVTGHAMEEVLKEGIRYKRELPGRDPYDRIRRNDRLR
jgi:hypothetical protein